MFAPVDPKVNFPQLDEDVLTYWKKNKTFEKSVESKNPEKKWTFLDGPPFVTGLPHYGHLLGSIHKDIFGRYWTMKGYQVRRVWGWDGHGLPVENKVENKLEIKRKKDIEEVVGVKKFIDECKAYVSEISGEWEWYVDHIGRWVDFKNAYKTWDTPYMESVMWVFKQMYDKGYIYKGLRVSLYCPHCATPISNFEVAMDADNYRDMEDLAATYKYKLVDEENTYILAWSTTPWNKLVTPVLAINPNLTYAKVKQNDEFYYLANTTLKMLKGEYEVVGEVKGSELVGKKFEPHYKEYDIEEGKTAFVLIPGDFVTAEEGTGVVTIAAYGEEDLKEMQEHNVPIVTHVSEEGIIVKNVPEKFKGQYYLKANPLVNEDLRERGLLYDDTPFVHAVPTCWRCHTRLYYAPLNAWYVDVQTLKPLLKETNEQVNWFPKHFKYGRFLKSLEHAPDWNISRNRYWGSPVPVWECECGERFVPGSIEELEEASGRKIADLHKPEIDDVTVTCQKCGKTVHRVPEVLDSWIEAGSASFAERHYPFNKTEKLEDFFPPDFIAEYTGQIRAWFYVLHVIGGALYKSIAFKNVGVEGVILGTDGRKMSKNLGNYPDPKDMLQKYGGDALRLYLMSSPIMHGEDIVISELEYRNQVRGILLIVWNVYNFFVTYANENQFTVHSSQLTTSTNVLDRWILSLLNTLNRQVTEALEGYDTVAAVTALEKFVNEFSTWYIRRSRERVQAGAEDEKDKELFFATTYTVLITLSQLMAPLTPFITEEIYRNLTGEESVHLSTWPVLHEELIDTQLEGQMKEIRKIVEEALSQRKENSIKVRQPLGELQVTLPTFLPDELLKLVKDEVNVKEVAQNTGEFSVVLNTTITPALKEEGEARDIVRQIQEERKRLGTSLAEKVKVTLPFWPAAFEEYIKKKALVAQVTQGETFQVERL